MSISYIVAFQSARGVRTTNMQYASVEDALRSLKNHSVSNRAISIFDNEDHLILPPDQVWLRLNPRPEYIRGISANTQGANVAAS